MRINEIKEAIRNYLKDKNMKLFECSYDQKDNILNIIIDEKLNMTMLEEISEDLSNFMDNYDEEFDKYILDVSTVGLERPIRNDDEIKNAIDSYIYIKTGKEEYYGYLLSFENDELLISYKDKNIKKQKTVLKQDIKQIRYAIDF